MDLSTIVHDLNIPVPPEVLVGIGTSDDAGVYKIGPDLNLVLTADFITPPCDDPFLFGRIAAANSLSDVYAMGGVPRVVLNLCCFPDKGISKETLTEILRGGLATTLESGAALIGGHTVKDDELKYGLSVTGLVRDADIKTNAAARAGDILILTKPIGTGLVVSGLRGGLISDEQALPVFERMAQLNKTACEVMLNVGGAHGVTDVTGFGLAGHSWEMARAAKLGFRFYFSRIPRWPISEVLAAQGVRTGVTRSNGQAVEGIIQFDAAIPPEQQMLLYDPQTAGGLLISVDPSRADKMLARLIDAGIADAAICGEVFADPEPHLEIEL
ncbi:MAG: selenide, water dikinase SelD [candidate division Zixibacteria bacterium]|nr:selenide, water dikinase SelD [candidate division Zixibacteria bacterium]